MEQSGSETRMDKRRHQAAVYELADVKQKRSSSRHKRPRKIVFQLWSCNKLVTQDEKDFRKLDHCCFLSWRVSWVIFGLKNSTSS
ncbi:hypothetical protein ElyMa_003974900 [Elysia marginata]|uniref:Uncharacterized protein n=1 Tax=Elysia marginata TaxID=1093978 RepID=A0AAV4FXN7_9GAST|nr:hypothetical protein ElyMa_003974900 [Elysia marginata]